MAKGSKTMYDPKLVTDLFSKVKGESSLAKLCGSSPMPFTGTKEFTFTMDKEIDVVAENGKKTEGGISYEPVTMVPIKFEYGARVPEEFMWASEEEKINIMKAFNDGFAKKLAKGFDIAAMHGFNPRTNTGSDVIGSNNFDAKISQTVEYNALTPDANLEAAIALVNGAEGDVSGIAISKKFNADLGAMRTGDTTNVKLYPQFAFGATPTDLAGMQITSNVTVSKGPATYPDHAILGDFAGAFKWGYGKAITFETIQYGDPDNSGKDLKGYGQVYLRTEAFLGWGILAPEYFARVVTPGA